MDISIYTKTLQNRRVSGKHRSGVCREIPIRALYMDLVLMVMHHLITENAFLHRLYTVRWSKKLTVGQTILVGQLLM